MHDSPLATLDTEYEYNGTIYRSKTEALWSALLQQLNIPFCYEPYLFTKDSAPYYLPDFYLKKPKVWLEIKSSERPTNEELSKAHYLHEQTQQPVHMVGGFAKRHTDTLTNFWSVTFEHGRYQVLHVDDEDPITATLNAIGRYSSTMPFSMQKKLELKVLSAAATAFKHIYLTNQNAREIRSLKLPWHL